MMNGNQREHETNENAELERRHEGKTGDKIGEPSDFLKSKC